MNFELEKPQFYALLFNIENKFWNNRPLFDILKEEFSQCATHLGSSGRIHVLGFDEFPKTHGESIYQINAFDKCHNLKHLKSLLESLNTQNEYDVHLFFLLDSLKKIYDLNKAIRLKLNNNYKIQFHFLFFGAFDQKMHEKLLGQDFYFSYLYSQKDLEIYLNNLFK